MAITRQQLKRNELLELVGQISVWIKNNPQNALAILGALLLVSVFGVYFFVHYQSGQNFVSDQLSYANNVYYYGKNSDEALRTLNEIIRNYPNSPLTTRALLLRSQIYQQQNPTQALADSEQVTRRKKPKEVIPLGYIQMGALQQMMGNYPAAVATYNEYLDKYPDHFYAPYVYDLLGTIYLATNNLTEAKNTYGKIVTMYPASYWAQKAQTLLAALNNQPASSPPAATTNQGK